MELEMTVTDGLLVLKAENCPEGMHITTAAIPFGIKQFDLPSARAQKGEVNGKKTQIFVLAGKHQQFVPHIPGKTAVKIVEGTVVVGKIEADQRALENWWERTLEFIKNKGTAPKKTLVPISDVSKKSNLVVEGAGKTRSRTRIIFE
jgi:hypothetical protein